MPDPPRLLHRPSAVGLNLNLSSTPATSPSPRPDSYFSFLRTEMIPIPRPRRGSDSVSTASSSSPPGAAGILAQLSESPSKPKAPSPYLSYFRPPPTPPRSHDSGLSSPSTATAFSPAPAAPAVSHIQAIGEPSKALGKRVSASKSMPRLGPAPVQPSFAPTIAQASLTQSTTPLVGFAPARATATASTSGAAGISIPRSQSASDRLSGMLAERPRSRSSVKSTKPDVTTLPSDPQTSRSPPSQIAPSRSNAADTPVHVFDAMARDVKTSTNTADKGATATAPSLKPKPDMDRSASPIPERTVASAGSRMPLESPATASRQRSRKERNDKPWLPTGLDDDGEIELNHVDAPSTSASTSAVTLQSDGDEYVAPYAVRAGAFQSKIKPEGERYALTFTASLSSGADLPHSRRRLELELLWDTAQLGIWAYVPGAQYLPSWRLRAAGKLSGTEREEGWVRWVAGGMPVVGEAVREWL